MPRIALPTSKTKSTKLIISIDGTLSADMASYIQYLESEQGESVGMGALAKLMLKTFINEDKEFAAWKKRKPETTRATADNTPANTFSSNEFQP